MERPDKRPDSAGEAPAPDPASAEMARLQAEVNRLSLEARLFESLMGREAFGLAFHDSELRFLRLNRTLAEINGLPVEAHLGLTPREVLPPGVGRQVEELLGQVVRSGQPALDIEISAAWPASPDELRYFKASYYPLNGPDGRIAGVKAVVLEITGQRQAEIEQQASQERFEALAEATTEGIYIHDNMRFIMANRRMEEMTGYSLAELAAIAPQDLIVPEDLPGVLARVRSGDTRPYEVRGRRKDGTTLELEISARNLNYKGRNWRVLALRDISERKQAALALQKSEERYRNLFEKSQDAIFMGRLDGTILAANPAACALLGYPEEEIKAGGRPLVVEETSPRTVEQVRQRAGDPAGTLQAEMHLRHRSGEQIPVETFSFPFLTAEGETLFYLVARDLRPRRRAEAELAQAQEQLRQSQKMEAIGRLAGGVAHDFNNLLTAIMGYADLIQARLDPQHPAAQEAQEIGLAAQRAAALTRQLLTFGRRQMLQTRRVDLNEVVENLERLLRRVIGADITLVTRLAPDPPAVEADPNQLEQVILNLAINARDAMEGGGRLTIETGHLELDEHFTRPLGLRPGRYCSLEVTDTGSGIDEAIREHIFEPFFTTKPPGQGSGLGLSTVYGIVRQSGGHIWFYSEAGQGTRFTVYFPAAAGPAETRPAAPPRRLSANGSETILLAEDDESVRQLAARVLEQHGYRVLQAGNGRAALQVAAEHQGPLDLAITDLVMPEMGGRELLPALLKLRSGLKTICISGYSEDALHDRQLLEICDAFLQKPFAPDALLGKVREVLDEAEGGRMRAEG